MTNILRSRLSLSFVLFLGSTWGIADAVAQSADSGELGVVKILYSPPGDAPNTGANYPRVIALQHNPGMEGHLIATFSRRGPSYLIFRSIDNGESWHLWSDLKQTKREDPTWGMNYQPILFELPQQVGEFPAGTVMAAGLSFPADGSATELQLYASPDGAKSWEYISTIAAGGPPQTRSANPVWEPYLWLDAQGRLVAYYADERHKDAGYNQLLAQKISPDGGRSWEDETYNVAIPDGVMRPGMPIIITLPNGRYFYVYEMVGMPGNPIHFKTSDDGLNWGDPADYGMMIQDRDGNFLWGTPFVSWSPYGGPNGTLIATGLAIQVQGDRVGNGVMINRNLGEGPWEIVETPIRYVLGGQAGYSQTHLPLGEGREVLQMVPVRNGLREHNDIRYAKFLLPLVVESTFPDATVK